MAPHVFISHSSQDSEMANAICNELEGLGFTCWIAPGQEWAEAIMDGITASRIMVVVLSANANDSKQVIREVERAIRDGLSIFPFRVEDVHFSKSLTYLNAGFQDIQIDDVSDIYRITTAIKK